MSAGRRPGLTPRFARRHDDASGAEAGALPMTYSVPWLRCHVAAATAAPTRGSASVLARLLRWRPAVRAGVASTLPVVRRALRRRPVRYSVISGSVAVLVAATIGVGLGVANAQEN